MRTLKLPLLLIFVAIVLASCSGSSYQPASGDVLFQDLESNQSMAIKLATGSEWTHVGIVFKHQGKFNVYEAVGPVRAKPLEEWINQGVGQHYVAKRLGEPGQFLTDGNIEEMKRMVNRYLGREYDFAFNWSDQKLYCSELVWKVYYYGYGLKLCDLHKLGDYDLSHEAVQQKMAERYGDNIPLDEPVVAPSDIFDSEDLYTVYEQ